MKTYGITAIVIILMMPICLKTSAGQDSNAATTKIKAQTTCPVMGGKIDKNVFVDVKGYRIYLCCSGCAGKIKADPDKYIEKIKAKGESLEKAPANEKQKTEANKQLH